MELNEISMLMDVKLDIHDKRPESLKLKVWTKCQVKIEAIKCLPCFLRINFQSVPQNDTEPPSQLTVSVNVPGVTISLATSRFKQHSYGLFWTHNRRDCFIYFALDTEISCRKHMKWIKKSIKNLELYRQVFFVQRRNIRGTGLFCPENKQTGKWEQGPVKNDLFALGPLPQIPDAVNSSDWSGCASDASEIYEEIFDGNVFSSRLSRRLSRTSIASGIYEEMKPCSININSILEERINCPPPLPPFPSHRKRLNTFESSPLGKLGEIPRSNTNPETDLARNKKNENVFENLLIGGRSKRSESVSETTACTLEDIIDSGERSNQSHPIYDNKIMAPEAACVKQNKRNSFSSPDLSKINFLDTFDEEKLADLLQLNTSIDLDAYLDDEDSFIVRKYSSSSLNEPSKDPTCSVQDQKSISGSLESLNVSAALPQNFNFSACNTSSINLVGASGAVPSTNILTRNKILVEDELSGYCIMAPIVSKKQDGQGTIATATSSTTSSTTSGYSTGSYTSSTSSSTSSNSQATENKESLQNNFTLKKIENFYDKLPLRKTPLPVVECGQSNLYEKLQICSPPNGSNATAICNETVSTKNTNFAGNLYENLLTMKATLELEQPANICTSTPTESPVENSTSNVLHQEESIYKTPRKSIISVDDKIPSYYPNSSETIRVKLRSNSPAKPTTSTALKSGEKGKSVMGPKTLVNIKIKVERKENLFITSPQKIIEQRLKLSKIPCSPTTSASKTKKSANAQKISDTVYTVNLPKNKTQQLGDNNSNTKHLPYKEVNETGQIKDKLETELLQLALIQKIDFKFDDTSATNIESSCAATSITSANDSNKPIQSGIAKLEQADLEYENRYQATKDAAKLLHKYATLTPQQSVRIKKHLQPNDGSDQKALMSQSTKVESPLTSSDATGNSSPRKFASLPRFKKIDFSPLKLKINNVLQRNHNQDF